MIFVFCLYSIETPILNAWGISAFSVDIALVTTLYLAATSSPIGGFITSIMVGFIADAFTPGGIIGMNMEINGLIFLMALGLETRFDFMRPIPLMVVILATCVVKTSLFFLFSLMFDSNFSDYKNILISAISHAFVTTMLGPLLYFFILAVEKRFRGKRRHSDFR